MATAEKSDDQIATSKFILDIVAKRGGHTFGFHREVEAETYSDAHKATRESLILDGWAIVKVRRDASAMVGAR